MECSRNIKWITVVLCLVTSGQTVALQEVRDLLGTRFVLTLQDAYYDDRDPTAPHDPVLYLATLSDDPVTVTVTAPHFPGLLSETRVISRGNIETVPVSFSLRCTVNGGVEQNGILVESTAEISIQLINQEAFTSDGLAIYPSDILGKLYYQVGHAYHILQVMASEPGTTSVTLTFSPYMVGTLTLGGTPYSAGDSLTFTLNQYEVYSLQENVINCPTCIDITGTKVVADKNVAVFGGSYLAFVSPGTVDQITEQMMPYETWGYNFAVISTPARLIGDVIRVVGATDGTTLTLSCIPGSGSLNEGQFIDYDFATGDYCLVTADQPVEVYLYAKSYDEFNPAETSEMGDPSLTLIPPTEQYSNQYVYSTMAGTIDAYEHYAAVVYPTDKLTGLLWNGQELATIPGATFQDIAPGWGWGLSGAVVPVLDGSNDVYHADPTVNFMVYVSGMSPHCSYGTLGGGRAVVITGCTASAMTAGDGLDNDCDLLVDEERANGLDDDGDGQIDEDLAALPRLDGEWGPWSAGECDCILEQETRFRVCDDPAPQSRGLDCVGPDTDNMTCVCTTTTTTPTTTTTTPTTTTTAPTTTATSTMTTTTPTTTTTTPPTTPTTITATTTTTTPTTTTATTTTTPTISLTDITTPTPRRPTRRSKKSSATVPTTTPVTTPAATQAGLGETTTEPLEPEDDNNLAAIIGGAVAAGILACCTPCLVAALIRRRKRKVEDENNRDIPCDS